ncbi:MAG: hypothetical protein KME28_20340 [Pelatocladus maniniholoensis HA4357-MV3]|jgi:hypothetical protein|uniref:Uncharacterized protein n=1 Tax=Pelatocladus maniniholoensis HA4357-MV3 TaxID=1117104 RepID=A0A9E3LUV1_9NOST|nr:hypothetical protein [Pelatocladus maniniholoensis HA4357-MV3]
MARYKRYWYRSSILPSVLYHWGTSGIKIDEHKPLAGLDWKTIIENKDYEKINLLDQLATQHIKQFWDRYELELPFAIEHKLDHTFTVAAYFNKAHYILRTIEGEDVYKIRGAKNFDDLSDHKRHPTYQLLWNIVENVDDFPESTEYTHTSLLKIGMWLDAQKSTAYEAIKGLRPGDEVVQTRQARYNNTHMPCDNVSEFKRRRQRKIVDHGQEVLWFERYAKEGIAKIHARMLNDTLTY